MRVNARKYILFYVRNSELKEYIARTKARINATPLLGSTVALNNGNNAMVKQRP